MSFNAAELTSSGDFLIAGSINTRLPVVTDGLVAYYPFDGTDRMAQVNLLNGGTTERTGANEYLMYVNLSSIFDTYGLGTYTFSFDLKAAVAGSVSVYCTDRVNENIKYYYSGSSFSATTTYQRFTKTVNVTSMTPTAAQTSLAFYGTYGTGVIPSVKNVKIEFGGNASVHCPSLNEINNITNTNTTLTYDGIAVEEATTNLIYNNLWGVSNVIDIPAPMEFSVAKRFILASEGSVGYVGAYTSIPASANTTYTLTYYARLVSGTPVSGTQMYINGNNSGSIANTQIYDLLTRDWQKFTITGTTNSLDTLLVRATFRAQAGVGGCVIEIADWQLEQKSFATSFVSGSRGVGNLGIPMSLGEECTINFDYFCENRISNTVISNDCYNYWWGIYHNSNGWIYMHEAHDGTSYSPNNFLQDLNTWSTLTIKWTTTTQYFYANGNLLGSVATVGSANSANIPVIYLGNGWNVGNGIFKNLSIYNRALSDTEIKQLVNPTFELTLIGDFITSSITSKPNIPSDAIYFPLGCDAKDQRHIISPSSESNTVYEDGAVWVGQGTTNMWAGAKTRYSWTTGTGTVTRDVSISEMPPPFDFDGVEVAKVECSGDYLGTILWTVGGIEGPSINYTHSIYVYLVDGDSVGIGQHWNPWSHNHKRYIPKGVWTRIEVTIPTVDNTRTSIAMEYYINKVGGGGKAYFCAPQFEKKSFSTPFVNGTRENTLLQFSDKLIEVSSPNWTICGWYNKADYPNDCYFLYKTGTGDLRLGNYSTYSYSPFWSRVEPPAGASWHPVPDQVRTTNTWKFFAMKRDGSSEVSMYEGMNGVLNKGTDPNGTDGLSRGYYFDGHTTTGWKLTAESGMNGWVRDLCFIQRTLTDDELNSIYKEKIIILNGTQIQGSIQTGQVIS